MEAVSSQFDHTFDDPVGDGISQTDYVGMLLDSLEMGKHVGVHRNFDELPALLRQAAASKDKWYIDVWPVKDHTSDTYELAGRLNAAHVAPFPLASVFPRGEAGCHGALRQRIARRFVGTTTATNCCCRWRPSCT